jgi:hypothetical protein
MKKKTIKAIETIYNGYKFRSRLEARWAVFFDEMGIKYEYEPEGFILKSGNYLPDFYISDMNLYVEIKPDESLIEERDIYRWMEFSEEKDLLLICGSPSKESLILFCKHNNNSIYDMLLLENKPSIYEIFELKYDLGLVVKFAMTYFGKYVLTMSDDIASSFYDFSIIKAKQARFEFNNK